MESTSKVIVHLANEQVFLDGFITNQDNFASNNENIYFVFSKGTRQRVKNPAIRTIKSAINYAELVSLIGKEPDILILHSLSGWMSKLISSSPKNTPIAWVFFGYEVFHRGENVFHFLAKKTRIEALKFPRFLIRSIIEAAQYYLYKAIPIPGICTLFQSIKRINHFAHWLEKDYEFICKKYPFHQMKYLPFCYSNAVNDIPTETKDSERKDLLIGNSASYGNNHADIIHMISSEIAQQFDKIIIPLPKSKDKKYVQKISRLASEKFENEIVIIDKWQEKDDYFSMISNVRLAVLGHYRSQAAANLRFFLKNKIDVAMFEKNSLYQFYHKNGIHIHRLEHLANNPIQLFTKAILQQNSDIEQKLHETEVKQEFYHNINNVVSTEQ